MKNKIRFFCAIAVIPLLLSCKWNPDEEAEEQEHYSGCYSGGGISLYLEGGVVAFPDGSYIYRIYRKKIGTVLASNFSLQRQEDGEIITSPTKYEKYYQIKDKELLIVDSSFSEKILRKVDIKKCQ